MIDMKYLSINQHMIGFDPVHWEILQERFFDALVRQSMIRLNKLGGYSIVEPGEQKRNVPVTWWTANDMVFNICPDVEGMKAAILEQLGPVKYKDVTMEQVYGAVYKELVRDPRILGWISDHVTKLNAEKLAKDSQASQAAQHQIRMMYDELANLPVQFLIPDNFPAQLFYNAGSQMYFIGNVRQYLTDAKAELIGTYQNEVVNHRTTVDDNDLDL